jgi:putative ABC transport system permease protein
MRWLLRRLLEETDRVAVESELDELHEVRRRASGEAAAGRWRRRETRTLVRRLAAERFSSDRQPREPIMKHLWRDVRFGLRSIVRERTVTATIVLTLGLGVGASAAMIGILHAVVVNPLPYDEPDSLVWIYTDNPPLWFRFSVVDYRALEADHATFAAVAGYETRRVTMAGADSAAERVTAKAVTGSYFPLMRQTPHLGRLFDPADDQRGDATTVLTHAFWQRRFGGDPAVLGRVVTIDGTPVTVVGVLQPTDGPLERDVALFTVARWAPPTRKGPFFVMALGRLRPDVSRDVVVQALRATNARLFPIWRSSYQDERATWGIQDLKARAIGDVGTTLTLVLAAVGCVLLIACANAMNLLLARAVGRSREMAIRGALGASGGRLLLQVMVEAALLSSLAAIVAVAVAGGALTLVARYGADYIPRVGEIHLSGAALQALVLLAAASAMLIGVVPALHASRVRINRALGSGGRSTTDAPRARRLRRGLVAGEFALATPLLVAAVLVMGSLDRLSRVDVGIDVDHLLTASISLPERRYESAEARRLFWERTLQTLQTLPGVRAAAIADSRPPQEANNINNFNLEDHPTPPGGNQPVCPWVSASPAFFKTLGLTLERGRLFTPSDLVNGAPPVIVVDRAWANRFFPGEEVLNRRLQSGGCTTCPWTTVIGVVSTAKFSGLDAADPGTVYSPFVNAASGFVTLSAAADPALLMEPMRRVIRDLDPELAVSSVATGTDLFDAALAAPRYLTVLVALLAIAAALLSVVGIWGVMSHFVQHHRRDLGIRLALGGDPASLRRLVIGQGVWLVARGIAVGSIAALALAPWLRSLLYEIGRLDIAAQVGVPAALVAIAAAACLAPARLAARVDPAGMLRES